MFNKKGISDKMLDDHVKKIIKDVEDGIEEDFNKDDSEQSFFINIEFRKASDGIREVGRLSIPESDKNDVKRHLIFAIDLLKNALNKLQ